MNYLKANPDFLIIGGGIYDVLSHGISQEDHPEVFYCSNALNLQAQQPLVLQD